MTIRMLLPLAAFTLAAGPLFADGPADNLPEKVRRVPPPGIPVPPAERTDLQIAAIMLGKEIDGLRDVLAKKPAMLDLLPDVQIFHNAVRYALNYDEFYDAKEFAVARKQLQLGMERAKQLRDGKPAWTTATGLVVRGYKSKIDDSIQPYGLVVPASYQPNTPNKFRLDLWWHGRGEKLTELSFLQGRMTAPGEFTPPHAFVLHPYGRYCNANKFAGEVDTFEAMEHVKKHYPIDENRVVARGFSMGGAACWQFAVHYPDVWCAAAPGAGFSETPDFLKVFQSETLKPTAYEQKLWHLYDCTDYALNLFNLPTVAYSGEIDNQKQAADMMAKALAKENMTLTHIIGAKTGHRYHPDAKAEIDGRIDAIVERGRNSIPRHIKFATFTLRYNKMHWVTIDEMFEHWTEARIDVQIIDPATIRVKTTANVAAFSLSFGPGQYPFDNTQNPVVIVDEKKIDALKPRSDRSWQFRYETRTDLRGVMRLPNSNRAGKRHGLQGPIDDAFMDRFIMVAPTGTPLFERTGKWVDAELAHAIDHWRRQFRGEALVKKDSEITEADIASSNLVLWGDPASNKILERLADKLPVHWDGKVVRLGAHEFSAGQHVPVLTYPNPLNPKKYVVLNSGFTFRDYDYLNNARQVPKLPDYAIIDVTQPVTAQKPGGIAAAGFFNEEWKFKR